MNISPMPDGAVVDAPAADDSDVWAGGGFLSTAEDLVRFGNGGGDDRQAWLAPGAKAGRQ